MRHRLLLLQKRQSFPVCVSLTKLPARERPKLQENNPATGKYLIMTLPRTNSPIPAGAAASSKSKPWSRLHPSAAQKFVAAEARLSACDDSSRAVSRLRKAFSKERLTSPAKTSSRFQRRLYRRKNFPAKVREQLLEWMRGHLNRPYPNEQEKAELAQRTGLDTEAVSTWFTNARVRYLPGLKAEAQRVSKTKVTSSISACDAVHNRKKRRVI